MPVASKISTRYVRTQPSIRRSRGLLAGVPALLLLAAGAQADCIAPSGNHTVHADGTVSRLVRYQDLDLAKQDDARMLYERLQNAAELVCGRYEMRDLRARELHRSCMQDALSAAVAKVNRASVQSLHDTNARIRVAQRRTETMPRT